MTGAPGSSGRPDCAARRLGSYDSTDPSRATATLCRASSTSGRPTHGTNGSSSMPSQRVMSSRASATPRGQPESHIDRVAAADWTRSGGSGCILLRLPATASLKRRSLCCTTVSSRTGKSRRVAGPRWGSCPTVPNAVPDGEGYGRLRKREPCDTSSLLPLPVVSALVAPVSLIEAQTTDKSGPCPAAKSVDRRGI